MSGITASNASAIGSTITGLANAGASIYGASNQQRAFRGQAESARLSAEFAQMQYNAQANNAEANARLADIGAWSAIKQGQHEAARLGINYGQMHGKQRNALAASGVDLSEGSAVEVQASSDIMKNIDMNTLEINALQKAWGFQTQALNYRNDAAMSRMSASTMNPGLAYTNTMLGGYGQVASSWLNAAWSLNNINLGWLDSGNNAPVDNRNIYGTYSTQPLVDLYWG